MERFLTTTEDGGVHDLVVLVAFGDFAGTLVLRTVIDGCRVVLYLGSGCGQVL